MHLQANFIAFDLAPQPLARRLALTSDSPEAGFSPASARRFSLLFAAPPLDSWLRALQILHAKPPQAAPTSEL